MVDGKKHVGVGFATGRTSFQSVLRAYIYHLQESHFLVDNDIALSLFVAYDPSYHNTQRADYDNLTDAERSLFYQCHFLGPEDIQAQAAALYQQGLLPAPDSALCFGRGYAAQRNSILFAALQNQVDYLLFLDDDEYPLAVTASQNGCLWSGQHVLEEHIRYLQFADYTNGYHCGYLSPMPAIEFDNILTQDAFHQFTDALSSDVLHWDTVQALFQTGGITYADKDVLVQHKASMVPAKDGARYISGGNLGINLTDPARVLPFYNPPGARGEDSLLSTCLTDYTVKSIPVYTFHDGFGFYGSLLKGVLPITLKPISLYASSAVLERFYRACVGWIRYKPLYTYLTNPAGAQDVLAQAQAHLDAVLPSVCCYFNNPRFFLLQSELCAYAQNVQQHADEMHALQDVWRSVVHNLFG